MKPWLLLLFLLLAGLPAVPGQAQTRPADSLRALLQANPQADTIRVRRLQALSMELQMMALPRAIEAMKQALDLSRQLRDSVGEGRALMRLATFHRRAGDNVTAQRYNQEARVFYKRRRDLTEIGKTYQQEAWIELQLEHPTVALQAALRGLPYAEKANDKIGMTRLQVIIGTIYVQLENAKEAIAVLRPALRNAEALNDKYMIAGALNMLGNAYRIQKNWPLAVSYLQRAVRENHEVNDLESARIDEINLSELYVKQGNLAQALHHADLARTTARAAQDAYNLPAGELAVARIHLLLGRTDSALVLARHALALSQVSHNKESLRNGSDILAQAYAKLGDFANAYHYQRQWVAYKDSVMGEDTQKNTAALRYGYELDKKQDQILLLRQRQQIQAQRAERQHQEMLGLVAGLVGLALLAGLLARNIFLKQRANRELNAKNEQIALQRDRLDQTLTKLKATQSQLVQSEKMVALAALTAGVAHEMQNPLNFVNNFSEVSLELLAELEEERQLSTHDPAVVNGLLADLRQNLRKINQHGVRASGIVKGMLDHAHADPGQMQALDLNALVEDYLRLAYHSLQAKHRDFTVARVLDLDPALGPLHAVPQELGRVLLNLFTNAFYAVHEKAGRLGASYQPSVRVRTRRLSGCVELHVRDNGGGISPIVIDRIFDPFFTTKPAGEGTGLGLWLSYDIVTKGYGGTIAARSDEGAFTELVVTLPQDQRPPAAPQVEAVGAASAEK
ncbi:sensor histidine kinase [Hymenobacter daeguensis]